MNGTPALFDIAPAAPEAANPVDEFACTLQGLTATVRKDARSAPLDKCGWVMVSPCGCMSGIIMAVCGSDARLTADQAMRALAGGAKDAEELRATGTRMVLVLSEDYNAHLSHLFKDCPHVRKWGVVRKTRLVNGLTFSRVSAKYWEADGYPNARIDRESSGWWWLYGRRGTFHRLDRSIAEALPLAAGLIRESPDNFTAASVETQTDSSSSVASTEVKP